MKTMTQLVIKLSQEMQGKTWDFPFEKFDMTQITREEFDSLGNKEIDVWDRWFDDGDIQSKYVSFVVESSSLVLHVWMNDSECQCCLGTLKIFILTPKK